jgi:hypothetical protein
MSLASRPLHSALRVPHSAFRTPHPPFRSNHSTSYNFRIDSFRRLPFQFVSVKPPRSIWRPLRWFILLATGGALLAADNTWTSKIRFDFKDSLAWLNEFYSAPAAIAELPAIVEQPANSPALSMNSLINGLLFSKPASGWQISAATEGTRALLSRSAAGPIVQINGATAALPSASFSSGFLTYTDAAYGPQSNAPTASGIWIGTASGNWSNGANWSAGVVADGAGNNANFSVTNISNDVTLNLDTWS